MSIQLQTIVDDFAHALKVVDSNSPIGKSKNRTYKPGVGPLTEAQAMKYDLDVLKAEKPGLYLDAGPVKYPGASAYCDLVLPGSWALEFKLLRPYGDNDKPAEHWSENILHPYPGNTSSIGDGLKLKASTFQERKGLIVFGFEHSPPRLDLEIVVHSFELITRQILGISIGQRCVATFGELIHPTHQQGRVYGWELI
ncbi:MAG: hypothetical protein FJ039_03310 [Chloroflexi bacterium]|nr:hypothetical protein [Chloroflexota bacterium]